MEGKTFKHKFLAHLVCTVKAETNRGFKVEQLDTSRMKPKPKVQFYDRQDFIGDKAFWTEVIS